MEPAFGMMHPVLDIVRKGFSGRVAAATAAATRARSIG
jgi:hypothetical protein